MGSKSTNRPRSATPHTCQGVRRRNGVDLRTGRRLRPCVIESVKVDFDHGFVRPSRIAIFHTLRLRL